MASALFNLLVPGAPHHKRTEREILPTTAAEARVRSQRFLKEIAIKPGLRNPSLISSCMGTIKTIMLAFPQYSVTDKKLAPAYQSVIRALRRGTKFVVVHQASSRAQIEKWFSKGGHAKNAVVYVPIPDYVNFTDWAEDGYVAVTDGLTGNPYLIEPWEFPRGGDALIADVAEDHTSIRASQAPLIFQGGNCLIGDRFWLLGKDYFADSAELLQKGRPPVQIPKDVSPEQFVRKLFTDYIDTKRKLIVIGTDKRIPIQEYYGTKEGKEFFLDLAADGAGTFQPIFHIDMFITLIGPAGRRQFEVMVGDPALADQRLGTQSPYALKDVYDAIAKSLSDRGMKVHRNPLVHWPTVGRMISLKELGDLSTQPENGGLLPAVKELIQLGAQGTTDIAVRSWHHITWNNCLVENSARSGKHVYLPTFGYGPYQKLAAIDRAMKSTWEKLGFEVHALGDFNEFAARQGVVHCIKKYIERGD